jgi:hypothetical protein
MGLGKAQIAAERSRRAHAHVGYFGRHFREHGELLANHR